ncbi:response regulator [Agarivorans sp. B2Z047]|uniref:response regulator n=1 Tax=Agarivorans sp. B2Z047 TaxID=2652721 RepID=UPI00128B1B94|nr:response regulator [Agarivorans sp. B2Z047]MPW30028.1 response regulator [Agarivorans sp. B2Z047]UQN43596.1 response regulator [Agarivorans sp. B2Z047]
MEQLLILCVDDEREVLDSVLNDIAPLSPPFTIDGAESVAEARQVIKDFEAQGGKLALILADHIMPDELGIDFLIDLNHASTSESAKKILLTGQAGLHDTIEAINRGGLNYYLAKPWSEEQLLSIIKEKLTDFVIEYCENPMPFAQVLDGERIFSHMNQHRLDLGN